MLYIETIPQNINYKELYEQSLVQIQSLQLQLAELKKMIFGSKGEKFVGSKVALADQVDLFPNDKLGQIDVVKTTLVKQHEKQNKTLNVNHPGRNPLPETLRREVISLLPDEDVSGLKPVRVEVSEQLEYQPGDLFVKRYERPEYIKPSQDGLNAKRIIAPAPVKPLEKAIAGASLLTHLLVSKYCDHLPLYRQLEIFKRNDVTINHTTVSGWVKQSCELLQPLFDLHCRQVLNTDYLCVDETTIKVLDKNKKETTHQGYYWVYYDTQRKLALFDYQPGRGALYPKAMLHKFKGYLQSDGYDAYETFDKVEGVTTLCCWAHSRRKFFEAQKYDEANAVLVLEQIQQLYKVEDFCRTEHFIPEQIKNHRQQHSIPILNKLKTALETMLTEGKVLPKSPFGKAIAYTLKRWEKLTLYTSNGILQIDNNLVYPNFNIIQTFSLMAS